MAGDPRLQRLLEEILDSDRTPEDVCRDCPELMPQVRERLRRFRVVEAQVDALFPTEHHPVAGATPLGQPDAEPPRFPGYEVQAVLGRGGMGIVYRARDRRLNRPVALKMLPAGAFSRPEEIERFLRGAEANAALRHPNIVQVYDVGDLDGRPYFTMEFVEGGSLAQRLSGKPVPADEAVALLATMAEAVQAAHDGGIVHRDLKPANILLAADGTPKITDFGLARRLDDGAGLTQSGATMGTPSYMAPEQAQGRTHAIGPASDVYALGAILYELLTGRPPFLAQTASETIRQVVEEEPVPPSRLNTRVSRDLETICLKCLHKEPQRRYPGAAALAEDVRRFQRGEPIAARPTGRPERLVRWVRRRRAEAAVLAAAALVGLGLVGGGLWLRSERMAIARGVEDDLREVARRQQEADWVEATLALERATGRLDRGGPAVLRRRLDQARRDLDQARREHRLATTLDAIHLNRMTLVEGRFNPVAVRRLNNARADRAYEAAFREARFGAPDDDPTVVALRIASSAARQPLVAALDDWAVCATDRPRQAWVLRVARRADPDAWRDRVRDPVAWGDPAALAGLARTAAVADQPVPLLVAMGERMQATGGDGTAFLARVRQAHPADFWVNLTLGKVHQEKQEREAAVACYQAASRTRIDAATVSNNLGLIRYAWYHLPGAIELYQQALRIDPRFAPAHNNLGLAFQAKGELDAAIGHYREALALDPGLAPAHANLGEALADKSEFDEAIGHDREALRLEPENARAHYYLGVVLMARGRLDEANDRFREALRINPDEARAHDVIYGLALNEGVEHYKQAVSIDPRFTLSHNNLGITPRDAGRLDEAIGHFEQALRIDPGVDPWLERAHAAMGQALLALGRFGEAVAATRRCLEGISQGHELHANVLAQLRRCERLLALQRRLPDVLQGKDKPVDAEEALEFAELCGIKSQFVAAARLYAEAFAASPPSTEELRTGRRYTAACAAALAGCGRGGDGAGLIEADRASWRDRARQWLRADLTFWASAIDGGPEADRVLARQRLTHLWTDPDLAVLLGQGSIDQLPPADRQESRRLWDEIEDLIRRTRALK
jgi:serine/threonine-protein kinase